MIYVETEVLVTHDKSYNKMMRILAIDPPISSGGLFVYQDFLSCMDCIASPPRKIINGLYGSCPRLVQGSNIKFPAHTKENHKQKSDNL